MTDNTKHRFIAEIKQVTSRKTASLDIEYKVVLVTNDPQVMNLGLIEADRLVDVVVEARA